MRRRREEQVWAEEAMMDRFGKVWTRHVGGPIRHPDERTSYLAWGPLESLRGPLVRLVPEAPQSQ